MYEHVRTKSEDFATFLSTTTGLPHFVIGSCDERIAYVSARHRNYAEFIEDALRRYPDENFAVMQSHYIVEEDRILPMAGANRKFIEDFSRN